MEIIEEKEMQLIELIAAEFNIEKCAFRAFFSYRSGTKPIFAIKISYYQSTEGTWKSFAGLQEPHDYMITAAIYEKLRNELQKISNSFIRQYKKGAEIDEKVNHVISDSRHLSLSH